MLKKKHQFSAGELGVSRTRRFRVKSIWKVLGTIGVILIAIFAGGIGKLVGKATSESFFEGKGESEMNSVLIKTASELNKNLPMMVDSETRWDATIGINKKFRYNYTMINYTAEDIDVDSFRGAMQPTLINMVCTTKEMDVFTKNGIPVTYAYYGKNGKQITTITVKPVECQNG